MGVPLCGLGICNKLLELGDAFLGAFDFTLLEQVRVLGFKQLFEDRLLLMPTC